MTLSQAIPLRPIKKITVMIDACVYRHNPAIGEQLAAMIKPLRMAGVECELLHDRLGLMEASTYGHELMLSEDVEDRRHCDAPRVSDAKRNKQYHATESLSNFLQTREELSKVMSIHYTASPQHLELFQEREERTKQYLFDDPRFAQWPKIKDKLMSRRLKLKDLDDMGEDGEYFHSLYTTCMKCACTINAIHAHMRRDPKFKLSLSDEDKAEFLLDKHKEGHEVYWDHINLGNMSRTCIPAIVVESFAKSRLMVSLLGRSGEYTQLGREVVEKHANWGEAVMEQQAREIAAAPTFSPKGDAVLLITDDGPALRHMAALEKEHPQCTVVTSREVAGMLLDFAGRNIPSYQVDPKVLERAKAIYDGTAISDSRRLKRSEDIKSAGTSFVNRLYVTSVIPADMRAKL